MSFDVYVQFFVAGHEAGVAEAVVRAAFPGLVEVLDDDYWLLRFGADDTTDLFLRTATSDATAVHALSFHRPSLDARLWAGIWELLGAPGAVYYFPESRALARDVAAIAQMPGPMAAAMGGAEVVHKMAALRPPPL